MPGFGFVAGGKFGSAAAGAAETRPIAKTAAVIKDNKNVELEKRMPPSYRPTTDVQQRKPRSEWMLPSRR
jgi:hypothetical protein